MARRRLTDAEREERRRRDRERSRQAVERLRTSEGWQRWLSLRRHFHRYSLGNQLLIALQKPEATRVAGFRTWLKLGYAVRRGERAIRIWVPMQVRDRDSDDPEAKKTIFKLGPVFDRSQVAPLPPPARPVPLDPPIEPIGGHSHVGLVAPLEELAAELRVSVSIEPVGDEANGYYAPALRAIVIDSDLAGNGRVATLIHELAHVLVERDRRDEDPALSYAEEELVVESIAYTVTGAAGLDVGGFSVPYLASWAEETPLETIERTARLIDRLARRIEDAIDSEPEREER